MSISKVPVIQVVQSTESIQVQKDWDDREFVEIIQLNVLKITSFLNQFDLSIRFKMSTLNEKLSKLERTIEYVECAFKTTTGPSNEKELILQEK